MSASCVRVLDNFKVMGDTLFYSSKALNHYHKETSNSKLL